jgi:SAM-dependent methyltransferase
MSTITTEMDTLKARLKSTWMAGDYGVFAKYLEPGALQFYERLQIEPGTSLLDVGCGAGQLAIPAARAGVKVTAIDLAPNLVEQARARARAEGLVALFDEGDAEQLPYTSGSFDTVLSLIGAMFAPRPERVATELVRVCRRGGRLIMANWTPAGFIGQMFKTIGKHVPPSPLMPSPLKWGDEETVRARLAEGVRDLRLTRRMYPIEYPFPPADVVEFFRTYYGPTNRAFAALDTAGQATLRHDLEQLWSEHNKASGDVTRIESEYLEVIGVRS